MREKKANERTEHTREKMSKKRTHGKRKDKNEDFIYSIKEEVNDKTRRVESTQFKKEAEKEGKTHLENGMGDKIWEYKYFSMSFFNTYTDHKNTEIKFPIFPACCFIVTALRFVEVQQQGSEPLTVFSLGVLSRARVSPPGVKVGLKDTDRFPETEAAAGTTSFCTGGRFESIWGKGSRTQRK